MTYQLHCGDMLDILPMMEPDSIDAIVTDPPYGLGFMGKDWDHGVPGMHFWLEALRVAKPGAHLLAFGGTRTFHRLTCAIEDAGWEIRDCVMWVYGQGFPKSHDVSKAIDREAGAEREVIGVGAAQCEYIERGEPCPGHNDHNGRYGETVHSALTQPATPAAAEWDGWGTALKPAWEPIIVARKPLVGTVAQNVQRYGTGAINVDACKIPAPDGVPLFEPNSSVRWGNNGTPGGLVNKRSGEFTSQGRWPANLIHDGSAEVLAGFPMTSSGAIKKGQKSYSSDGSNDGYKRPAHEHYFALRDISASTGSAARFFYCAKASKQDRDEGLDGFEAQHGTMMTDMLTGSGNVRDARYGNHHPTVKPTALMRYLCRLVTPPNGVILDPFMGSGSTGKAAILEGFNFVGVELEQEYIEIAARRIEHACGKVGIVVEQPMMIESRRETVDAPKQLVLI